MMRVTGFIGYGRDATIPAGRANNGVGLRACALTRPTLLRERLYKIPGIRHSKSSFVLRQLKHSHLPLRRDS